MMETHKKQRKQEAQLAEQDSGFKSNPTHQQPPTADRTHNHKHATTQQPVTKADDSQQPISPISNKIKIAVATTMIICTGLAIFLTLFLLQHYHLRDTFALQNSSTYTIPHQDRSISTANFEFEHKYWNGDSQKVQGQLITLPSSNNASAIPGIISINDAQSGISLKQLGNSNYFIEVDYELFLAYYEKTHPIETKRRLAYLYLTRNLAATEQPTMGSQLQQQKIVQSICQKTNMDPKTTTLQQLQYHIATHTDQGFVLQREQPKSSRLLQFAPHRQLYFYDLFLAYLMATQTAQMADAADEVRRAQDMQQKGVQPVIVITVINIVNNSNVVINLNSSTNVVINNNHNKEVRIVPGTNEPVIQDNTNKRMLTVQQTNTELDQRNAISKTAFQYAALCSATNQTIQCPAGYFHRPNNPFTLAAEDKDINQSDVKIVKKILIGQQTLLTLDQLEQQLTKQSSQSSKGNGEGPN